MKIDNGVWIGVALSLAAGSANARTYAGSDTLGVFVKRLVINCQATHPGVSAFDYVGGGSGAGGTQMKNGVQDIAPQSRKMNTGECGTTSVPTGPAGEAVAITTNPQNLPIARDAISIVTSEASSRRCDDDPNTDDDFLEATDDDFGATIAFSGTLSVPGAGAYSIADWRDVLRIIYTGGNLNPSPAAADPHPPVFSVNTVDRVARCGSALRRALVDQWDNIIQDVAGANACNSANSAGQDLSGSCQDAAGNSLPLRHAFRQDDLSGTTEVFLSLLGLPAINAALNPTPFCNGLDTEDRDPIARGSAISAAGSVEAGVVAEVLPALGVLQRLAAGVGRVQDDRNHARRGGAARARQDLRLALASEGLGSRVGTVLPREAPAVAAQQVPGGAAYRRHPEVPAADSAEGLLRRGAEIAGAGREPLACSGHAPALAPARAAARRRRERLRLPAVRTRLTD